MLVKKIEKSANIWRRYEQKFAAYFLGRSVSPGVFLLALK